MKNTTNNIPEDNDAIGPPPGDELDALLRQWHKVNADKAAAGRDRLMAALVKEDAAPSQDVIASIGPSSQVEAKPAGFTTIRRIVMNRYSGLVAAAIAVAVLLPFIWTGKGGPVAPAVAQPASNIVMAPDGGRLDAIDKDGNLLGPCELKHTDVKAEISGRFSRVTVTQKYHNSHSDKIEAVYTFPLSDRGGVDRMTMTIGDRVIVGEVKERQAARSIYEQARDSGRVASLLEQERPNIFTQSVANIEPGATVDIEISYVEIVAEHDGEFSFDFPTVVGPRYIPGSLASPRRERMNPLPTGSQTRAGLVLPAPPIVAKATIHDTASGERKPEELARMLAASTPIAAPTGDPAVLPAVWYEMDVKYPDGSGEPAVLLADGRGAVDGRWFFCPPTPTPPAGEPFAQPTDKVPDADRITPMPVRPGTRAGHDISISVTIDTGGPGITTLGSELHKVSRTDLARNALDQPRRVSISLANLSEIPNRDFVLKWKQTSEAISYRAFTHTGDNGNFFGVQLDPPARVDDVRAVPRELIFVVDTSGSMNGRPIALCRDVMQKAVDAMRLQDTFNIITFAGTTRIMWDRPRPNTTANRDEAQRFIATWEGSGGTEMMTAIEAALQQGPHDGRAQALTPAQLADLPADGRQVIVEVDDGQLRSDEMAKGGTTIDPTIFVRDDLSIKCSSFKLHDAYMKRAAATNGHDEITLKLLLRGTWITDNGQRIFKVASSEMSSDSSVRPLRVVMFLTDAYVGNDFEIINAIKKNRATTRVFSFGIGNSVNNWLINQMAAAGGGEPDFIYASTASEAEGAAAVERFNRRTKTPVLTDISVTFNGVKPLDVLPDPTAVQDLYDQHPLTFLGRYTGSGNGSITIKGQTAQGRWEKTIPITFPDKQPENSSLPTLWARAKIDSLVSRDLMGAQNGQPNPDVRAQIVQIGETFNVMSQYTSFVAVDKLRVTIEGKPRLVHVPIELPDQTNWAGFFGELQRPAPGDEAEKKDDIYRKSGVNPKQQPVQLLTIKEEALGRILAVNEQLTKAAAAQVNAQKSLENFIVGEITDAKAAAPAGVSTGSPSAPAPPPTPTAMPAITTPPPGAAAPPAPRTESAAKSGPSASTPKPSESAPRGGGGPAGTAGQVTIGKNNAVELKSDLSTLTVSTAATQGLKTKDAGSNATINFRLTPQNKDRSGSAEYGRSKDALVGGLESGGGSRSESSPSGSHYGLLPWSLTKHGYSKADADSTYAIESGEGTHELGSFFMYFDMPNSAKNLALDGRLDAESLSQAPAANDDLMLLAACQLADSGRIDDAKNLACNNLVNLRNNNDANIARNVQQNVSQPPADRLCGALNSNLPDEERKAAINEARVQVSNELLSRRRESTLGRKLAPELLQQTPTAARYRALSTQNAQNNAPVVSPTPAAPAMPAAPATPDDAATKSYKDTSVNRVTSNEKESTPPAPAKFGIPAQPLLITILLTDTSTKTIDLLKSLGLQIDAIRPEANIVIARVMPDKLEELALLDVVKRVEPVSSE